MARESDPLALSAQQMREMAHATLDMLIEMVGDLGSLPAQRRATPAEMKARLPGVLPAEAVPFERLLGELRENVVPYGCINGHPRFFAFVPGGGTFPGMLADLIASALNFEVSSWMEAAGPSRVEAIVIDWFKQWIGYPPAAEGVLVSGGSAANLTALACAREAIAGAMRQDLIVYACDQAHSSVARAARALGFRPEQMRILPSDGDFRLRPDALQGAIAADREAGLTPFAACASAGSTNTGAIDPLPEVASICEAERVWLHVDGAYGGFAAITERGRAALAGIERADSVTLDPHKWLYQPFECGCLLVREGSLLEDAFRITPHYLKDAKADHGEIDFADRGLQLSRMARGLKVWMSVRAFGIDAFRDAIDRCLDLALLAERRIEESEEFELLSAAKLGIVCFRRLFGGERSEDELEELNRRLVAALDASGYGLLSSTRLGGVYAIRICVLNHTSGESDVLGVLDWMERAELDVDLPAPAAAVRSSEPSADLSRGLLETWAGEGDLLAAVREVPLFEDLDAKQLADLARSSRIKRFGAGDRVITRWSAGRDFFVILEGRARVELEQGSPLELGPGEFFGELAALDWGAGYGYVRLATVSAVEPLSLLAVPAETLNGLLAEAPTLAAEIEAAAKQRIHRT